MTTSGTLIATAAGFPVGVSYSMRDLTASRKPDINTLFQDNIIHENIKKYGFILIEDDENILSEVGMGSREIEVSKLTTNLCWHIDKKDTLMLYYPIGCWRPGDVLIGRKTSVVSGLAKIINACQSPNPELKRLGQSLSAVNTSDASELNYMLGELSGLNYSGKNNQLIHDILCLQLENNDDIFRLEITPDKSQLLIMNDSVKSDICHARIRNSVDVTGIKSMTYYVLPECNVIGYF